MTSCVFTAFFFVSLVSSVAAADPTGLKLRITSHALHPLKDFGLQFLQQMVNRPPQGPNQQRKLKLTELTVNPDNANVRFGHSGLLFDIKDLDFAGNGALSAYTGIAYFRGKVGDLRIKVTPKRNPDGRLYVEIPMCEVKDANIALENTGFLWWIFNKVLQILQRISKSWLCNLVNWYAVPAINDKLKSLTMTARLHEHKTGTAVHVINFDYGLSNDITMTASYLDVPFKGVIFREGETVDLSSIKKRVDPFFSQTKRMVYVGVSEFAFNSAAMSLFKAGPFEIDTSTIPEFIRVTVLKRLGLSKGPLKVQLTNPPTVRINQDGVSTILDTQVQSSAEKTIVPMVCKLNMKINIKGNHLFLLSENPAECKIQPTTGEGTLVKWLVNPTMNDKIRGYLKSLFEEGLPIPLPEGMSITEGMIEYHDGFVVIGGNLNFTPAGQKKMLGRIKG